MRGRWAGKSGQLGAAGGERRVVRAVVGMVGVRVGPLNYIYLQNLLGI